MEGEEHEKKVKKETTGSKEMEIVNFLAAQTRILLRRVARLEAKSEEKGKKDGCVLNLEAAFFVPGGMNHGEEPRDGIVRDDVKLNVKAGCALRGRAWTAYETKDLMIASGIDMKRCLDGMGPARLPAASCDCPGGCPESEWNSRALIKEFNSMAASLSLELASVGPFGEEKLKDDIEGGGMEKNEKPQDASSIHENIVAHFGSITASFHTERFQDEVMDHLQTADHIYNVLPLM